MGARAAAAGALARKAFEAGLVALLALAFVPLACSDKREDDGTKPTAAEALPPLTLRDDTPNLLLTWLDDKGDAHTEVSVADVPAPGRAPVRVIVTDRSEGHGNRFYVADLGRKKADGSYEVSTMTRAEWEAEIDKRRSAYLAKHAPPPPPPGPGPSAGPGTEPEPTAPPVSAEGLVAIVYGADWCKPCHMARAYLEKRGVKVVHKDVDRDPAAQAEMARKLERSGQRGAAIPVIDVAGTILVGFSTAAIDAAIARAKGGTRI